jgi:hypothetical protein
MDLSISIDEAKNLSSDFEQTRINSSQESAAGDASILG